MLVSFTIRCDWPGCKATLTVAYRAEIGQKHRWKAEGESDYSQHLCPAHKRHDWEAADGDVQGAAAGGGAPDTRLGPLQLLRPIFRPRRDFILSCVGQSPVAIHKSFVERVEVNPVAQFCRLDDCDRPSVRFAIRSRTACSPCSGGGSHQRTGARLSTRQNFRLQYRLDADRSCQQAGRTKLSIDDAVQCSEPQKGQL